MPSSSSFNAGSFGKKAAVGAAVLAGAAGIAWWTHASPGPTNPVVAADIYIANAAAGSGDGSSCANAKAYTFFNDVNQWGAGKTIAPGKTVGLCGTITHELEFMGNGTAGSPITALFQPGAKISEPVCPQTGCFYLGNGPSYVTIDGGLNGIIEDTANGTGLANSSGSTSAIYCQGCSHVTVKNLTLQNLYVRTATTDENLSAIGQYAIQDYNGSNDTYTHLTIHDSEVGIGTRNDQATTMTNLVISNNTFTNIDHDIALISNAAGGNDGPVTINNNNFTIGKNWDDTVGNFYHHSFLHCFTSDSGAGPVHLLGLYVYNNIGNMGSGLASKISGGYFIESSAGGTPCDDSTSNNYFFNNVILDAVGPNNGDLQMGTGTDFAYNNTIVGPGIGAGSGVTGITTFTGGANLASSTVKNNVVTSFPELVSNNVATYTSDFNIYGNGGTNSFEIHNGSCSTIYTFAQFATWQTCIAGDASSSTTADAKLDANGKPQAGSPAIASGTNLTSLCTGALVPLCSDINGAARPAVGAWDAGAVNH